MRFFKWIKVFLQGGRCYRCKHYHKPYRFYDVGYCTRWATRVQMDIGKIDLRNINYIIGVAK